ASHHGLFVNIQSGATFMNHSQHIPTFLMLRAETGQTPHGGVNLLRVLSATIFGATGGVRVRLTFGLSASRRKRPLTDPARRWHANLIFILCGEENSWGLTSVATWSLNVQ